MNPVNFNLARALENEVKERDFGAKEAAAARGEPSKFSAFGYSDPSSTLPMGSSHNIQPIHPQRKPVVVQPAVAKPAVVKPAVVKPAAKQVAMKPAAMRFQPVKDFPFKAFFFERKKGDKLYFCASFQPMEQKARDLLKEHGLKVHERKSVMSNGLYYTKNQGRQLALLELAQKLCKIADQLDCIKQVIRKG